MKQKFNLKTWSILTLLISVILFSCKDDLDENRPLTNEAINFINPDTTTIFADAGSVVDFNLYLAIDQAIDSVRAAYIVDTSMIVTNLTFNDMDSTFFVQGYADSSNVQYATGSFLMPLKAYDTIPFKPYFGGSTSPFIAPSYDAVRIVFKVEAEDNTTFEKQLKIIVN